MVSIHSVLLSLPVSITAPALSTFQVERELLSGPTQRAWQSALPHVASLGQPDATLGGSLGT